jgi:hypothetical protein
MTTTDIIPLRDNKYYCFCDQHERELKIIEDQITCLQKSVANLRKDMPELVTKRNPKKNNIRNTPRTKD